jgi:hypothetical protein
MENPYYHSTVEMLEKKINNICIDMLKIANSIDWSTISNYDKDIIFNNLDKLEEENNILRKQFLGEDLINIQCSHCDGTGREAYVPYGEMDAINELLKAEGRDK